MSKRRIAIEKMLSTAFHRMLDPDTKEPFVDRKKVFMDMLIKRNEDDEKDVLTALRRL